MHRTARFFSLWLACACCLAFLATPRTVMAAADFDLPSLMQKLAQVRSGEAEFTEQRFVRTLDEPLVSSGTLSFSAPDRFTRRTLKPRVESMSVDGNTVTLARGGRNRTFTLDAAPEMVAVVEAVRGTLTGNGELMQRYFTTSVTGTAEQWQLTLTPRDSRIGGQVRQVSIGGRGSEVNRIEMSLTDGDRSVMTIVQVSASSTNTPATTAAPASASTPAR
ncbi:hypothetical protein BH09PSE5_BH09PSE5_29680 [soil metagenome]